MGISSRWGRWCRQRDRSSACGSIWCYRHIIRIFGTWGEVFKSSDLGHRSAAVFSRTSQLQKTWRRGCQFVFFLRIFYGRFVMPRLAFPFFWGTSCGVRWRSHGRQVIWRFLWSLHLVKFSLFAICSSFCLFSDGGQCSLRLCWRGWSKNICLVLWAARGRFWLSVCKNRERIEFWVWVLVRRDISQGGYFYRSFL